MIPKLNYQYDDWKKDAICSQDEINILMEEKRNLVQSNLNLNLLNENLTIEKYEWMNEASSSQNEINILLEEIKQ